MKEYLYAIVPVDDDLKEMFGAITIQISPKNTYEELQKGNQPEWIYFDDEDDETLFEMLEKNKFIQDIEWIFSTDKTEEETRNFFSKLDNFTEIDELYK